MFLETKEIKKLALVSKRFQMIDQQELLWKQLIIRDFTSFLITKPVDEFYESNSGKQMSNQEGFELYLKQKLSSIPSELTRDLDEQEKKIDYRITNNIEQKMQEIKKLLVKDQLLEYTKVENKDQLKSIEEEEKQNQETQKQNMNNKQFFDHIMQENGQNEKDQIYLAQYQEKIALKNLSLIHNYREKYKEFHENFISENDIYNGKYSTSSLSKLKIYQFGYELLAVKQIGNNNIPAGKISFYFTLTRDLKRGIGYLQAANPGYNEPFWYFSIFNYYGKAQMEMYWLQPKIYPYMHAQLGAYYIQKCLSSLNVSESSQLNFIPNPKDIGIKSFQEIFDQLKNKPAKNPFSSISELLLNEQQYEDYLNQDQQMWQE